MILWVRHGQSTWNVIDRMQGHELSPPLTELGREQAARTAELLADRGRRTHPQLAGRPCPSRPPTSSPPGSASRWSRSRCCWRRGSTRTRPACWSACSSSWTQDLPGHTVAVSHGDTIGLAVGLLSGQRPELPANGSITQVDPDTRQVAVAMP